MAKAVPRADRRPALRPGFPAHLKGILFDLGGTLDGDGEHWLNRFYLLYQEHLPQVSWDCLKTAFYQAEASCLDDRRAAGLDLAGLVHLHVRGQLAALGMTDSELANILAQKFFESCRVKLQRNAGVLTRLGRRYLLGVVTNSYGNAARILAEADILPLLTVIVDSQVAGVRKPNPAIFPLALSSLELPPDAVAFVGDSYTQDIRPAKGAGLVTVWLRNDAMAAPLPPDFAPEAADYQIKALPELEALVS